ncbi:bridging integrator 2a [Acanthopagrus latus]|uniref:bridging integrator 2a n=1 Tax=Acanthopagrus latus TaxID=8177 RepID=UPI00187C0A1C|nr:bridging integrator 2a [Acanthopagrus latus]XP_036960947.1 bridging integrator 2a [Acanthopagrus latus]
MADNTSPKGSSGDFAKKVQRQLSRGKEKVLQKLGKAEESRDEQFEHCLRQFNDQQTDGNRIYKDLRNYINAVRDMREASRRLSQSLFDSYESTWAGEEDLGGIVEGEDLLWNDYEVKLLDQAVRNMETYVSQFPDVREKIAKRGRKLVDYDSTRHHLEALQSAKKRDDIKINKADEEMKAAKNVYEGINNELKDELPGLFESRIGCYISVFSAVSNLREIFYKEMSVLNGDLQNVLKELQAQHPDKVFEVRGLQRYGSLRRRTLMSPKAWKASFSEFHRSYSPKTGQRFSFRSPDKPRHSTLSREGSTLSRDGSTYGVSSQSSIIETPSSESRDLDAGSSHSEITGSSAEEDSSQVEKEKGTQEEESEPPAESDNKGDGEKAPSESSSELNISCDSVSLDLQLSAADGPLHIEERDDSPVGLNTSKPNGLENGEVSGVKDLSISHKDAPAEKSPDPKSTTV